MEEKEIHDELASIRSLMERSSKFISLSGLSGILAGVYALVGAGVAYKIINDDPTYAAIKKFRGDMPSTNYGSLWINNENYSSLAIKLFIIAVIVFIASITTAIILSNRQAKRKGQSMWGKVSRSLFLNMAVPLVSGGFLILVFLYHHHYGIVSSSSLIFYGIALFIASNFTFNMVKYLGLCEIALGLIAACLPGYGLLFWAFGFGVLHIVYGSLMYLKYDK